jgi:hypothetical protein
MNHWTRLGTEIGDGDSTGHERSIFLIMPFMSCTLCVCMHAGRETERQGRRTCGRVDRCTSTCTHVREEQMEGYVSVAARRFFTSLCGTERAWTVILFSVDIAR